VRERFAAAPADPYRYGVYLRPDPQTCMAVTQLTDQLRAQYGLVSAGAFPPHATLVGSQHVDAPAADIVKAVSAGLAGRSAFPVHNAGIVSMGHGYVYDVHHLPNGSPNSAFVELAAAVDAAVAPLVTPAPDPEPHLFDRERFRAHLSLASHDLMVRPDLAEEVGEFLRGLPIEPSAGFAGDTVALYRTRSDDWTGRWWSTLTWEHVHTWRLPSGGY
jgi:2'-5' RNA ligase